MSKTGRPPRLAGTVFARTESAFWWIRYPNRDGELVRESTGTTDKQEAERFLRARLDARDEGRLPIVLSGKTSHSASGQTGSRRSAQSPRFDHRTLISRISTV
jgi:hypothetical protein